MIVTPIHLFHPWGRGVDRGSSDRQGDGSPCTQARCGFVIFCGRTTSLCSSKTEDSFFFVLRVFEYRAMRLPADWKNYCPAQGPTDETSKRIEVTTKTVLCKHALGESRTIRCRVVYSQPANFLPLGWEMRRWLPAPKHFGGAGSTLLNTLKGKH